MLGPSGSSVIFSHLESGLEGAVKATYAVQGRAGVQACTVIKRAAWKGQ